MNSYIGIFSITDQLGGAEQILFKISEFYLNNKKNNLKIFFFNKHSSKNWFENNHSNLEIIYLNYNLFLLLKYLNRDYFDKVYSSHLIINAVLGFLRTFCILKTKKLIVRESTQVFGRYIGFKLFKYKLAYFFGYRNIDIIICQTQRMYSSLKMNVPFLFNRTKVCIIPNPFEYPLDEEINEQIDIVDPFLVAAGRLIPEKGFDVLIAAYYKFQLINPDCKLVILGQGDILNDLKIQVNNLSLGKQVILKGHVNNVYSYFKQAEICVVSSIKEGFPNVLLQMMSQNNRVVSTNCAGGISEFKGIFVAKVNDIDDLYSKLIDAKKANVSGNRFIFDNELKNRTVANFIYKLNELL